MNVNAHSFRAFINSWRFVLSPEARLARNLYLAKWRAKNRDRTLKASREFRARNRERVREESRVYQHAYYHAVTKHDPVKVAAKLAKVKAYYVANSEKVKKLVASYRRNALIVPRQTPKWANRFYISEIYDLAKRRSKCLGIAHEVDHVIPLRGKLVCGLHVETNLSIVPKSVNRAKGAKFMEI